MEKRVIPSNSSPRIFIRTNGDLTVKGDAHEEVIVRTDSDDLKVETEDDEVRISSSSDLIIRVPRGAHIETSQVNGSAAFKVIEGSVAVHTVNGSLSLKDVGPTSIQHVMGDLIAKQVDGDLEIDLINGDARINGLRGDLVISKMVNGDLKLEDIEGNASVHANGSIHLELDPGAGQKLDFQADGNLLCRLAEDASVSVHILKASEVKINLEESRVVREGLPYHLTLGEGDAELNLSASGNVLLSKQAPEWGFGSVETDFKEVGEDISGQISAQLEAQMQMMESQIEAQLENLNFSLQGLGLSPEAAERLSRKAREASVRATARAQEKMQKAQEKIQRRLEAAQRKAEAKSRAAERRAGRPQRHSWGFDWPSPPTPPAPPSSDPVSEAERLMILKMLEEHKITPEEADRLLEALEGK